MAYSIMRRRDTLDAMDLKEQARVLEATLQELGKTFVGGGGNCAQVACVLDDLLETGGDFVIVSGGHYEFADHVFVRWQGLLWDMGGARTWEEAEQAWCSPEDEDDEEVPILEGFKDPDQATIERMADSNCILSGGFDQEVFRRALLARLQALGWPDMEAADDATSTVGARPSGAKAPGPGRRP